jgi:uncharacterized protein (DUF1501 family)
MNRRHFLTQLVMAAPPMVEEGDRHTLVCVFLRGGADTMNFLVPYADDAYYRARPTIGIKRPGAGSGSALMLDDRYGLHPLLAPLQEKYGEGRLAVVQGVGTDNTTGSHFECQDQMEHGDAMEGNPAGGGWLGRYLRARADTGLGPLSAVAIGATLPESMRGAPVVSVLRSLNEIALKTPSGKIDAAAQALAKMYGADVTLLGRQGKETLELFHRVRALQTGGEAPAHGVTYPKDPFGEGLREVAKLIKARIGLEVACLDLGGWDTHFLQGGAEGLQAGRIKVLGEGLAAFDRDLTHERDRVTVLVMTEFGRRIYENSSLGTDHGRGFATLVLGNKIKGGRVLGGWPCVVEETLTGPGGMKIEHDYRQVFAEVLQGAMGLERWDTVFPGLPARPTGLLA